MDLQTYIQPELLILIPVLYAMGMGLKKWQGIGDKWIPLTLGGAGVVLAALYLVTTPPIGTATEWASLVFAAVTQGVLCAAASVYVNQVVVQAKKDKEE